MLRSMVNPTTVRAVKSCSSLVPGQQRNFTSIDSGGEAYSNPTKDDVFFSTVAMGVVGVVAAYKFMKPDPRVSTSQTEGKLCADTARGSSKG